MSACNPHCWAAEHNNGGMCRLPPELQRLIIQQVGRPRNQEEWEALERRLGIPLWRSWARLYLPFIFYEPNNVIYNLVTENIWPRLDQEGLDKWGPLQFVDIGRISDVSEWHPSPGPNMFEGHHQVELWDGDYDFGVVRSDIFLFDTSTNTATPVLY